jgi:16S rRNA (cytidine1402-2'-O)-methyltransferase
MTVVYLIPTVLAEGQTDCLPPYLLEAVKQCQCFFVENERTARRFLKLIWKDIVIDDYRWFNMKEVNEQTATDFHQQVKEGKNIGIISEAGCPGVADPGQQLVQLAQEMNLTVKPLVGPSSILLALMASGMNGQQFQFVGYLPIDPALRLKSIKNLEVESRQKNCTQIFIETPYRNNQMLETLSKVCHPATRICVAVDLTAPSEWIHTRTALRWKAEKPELHKRLCIFLLQGSGS